MNVLAVDVGGTHVKFLVTGHDEPQKFVSGKELGPKQMVATVKKLAVNWPYEVVSIGYPGPILHGHIINDPYNLGPGWVGFDFEKEFGCPVKLMNDAAMQALGSYEGRKMLFLGLGTGLGSAMVIEGIVEPMELAHLPYKKGTYEDYVGLRGLKKYGKKKWRRHVEDIVAHFVKAMEPDEVVLGGGNVKHIKHMPPHCRAGSNANAFLGGFRLWDHGDASKPSSPGKKRASSRKVNGSAVSSKAQAGA